MRSFRFWLKVCRLHHCIAAALGTWIAALLSNGSDWWSPVKEASSASMAFGCLGASLYHYGAANKMYARKYWDVVDVDRPALLVLLGLLFIITSVIIAAFALPVLGIVIVACNALVIICYAHFLAKHWATKNLAIAFVCASPVLVGWFSGHRINPVVPLGLLVVFCGYWAREILKDISDIEANCGIRVTLPLRIGALLARRIAGGFTALSVVGLVLLGGLLKTDVPYVIGPYVVTLAAFGIVLIQLFRRRVARNETSLIIVGTWSLMVTFLGMRIIQ